MLHVFEIEHPNIPEWLFPGGLTLTATQAYRFTRPATDRPIRLPQRYRLSRARENARTSFAKAVNALA
jgi:hypothetical protein